MLILTPRDGNEEKELKKGFVEVRLSRLTNAEEEKNPFYAPQMADKKEIVKFEYVQNGLRRHRFAIKCTPLTFIVRNFSNFHNR